MYSNKNVDMKKAATISHERQAALLMCAVEGSAVQTDMLWHHVDQPKLEF